ncbi:MAG: hypothetical protein WC050_01100 [Candidatus Paceibacterota bacterium]
MFRDGKDYFQQLGAAALLSRKPSKLTIVNGRHLATEDERSPEWRKEVCDELALLCAGMAITDDVCLRIETDVAFEANLLSVGSRARLVSKIEAMVRLVQLDQAAE